MAKKHETFTMTKDHLKLLKNMWVQWESSMAGAPMIDCKRPYGNSDHIGDVARVLGWKLTETADGDEIMTKKQGELAEKLHLETKTALQICLCTQSFKEGVYELTEDYDDTSWKFKSRA